jgi:uridine kinase
VDRSALLAELAARIAAVRRPHPVRVAIDGVDAAGKTTLADELAGALRQIGRPVVRASLDGFHRPAAERHRRGACSPEGYYQDSFDYAQLLAQLLEPLGPGGSWRVRCAVFDCQADAPVAAPVEAVPPDAVLLFDGVFLMRPVLRGCWDYSIFVRADFAVTVARAERRDAARFGDAAEVRRRYAARYVPGQVLYLQECDPERWASVVVDNNDPTRPRLVHDESTGPRRSSLPPA